MRFTAVYFKEFFFLFDEFFSSFWKCFGSSWEKTPRNPKKNMQECTEGIRGGIIRRNSWNSWSSFQKNFVKTPLKRICARTSWRNLRRIFWRNPRRSFWRNPKQEIMQDLYNMPGIIDRCSFFLIFLEEIIKSSSWINHQRNLQKRFLKASAESIPGGVDR